MEHQLAQVLMQVATGRRWSVYATRPADARVFPGGDAIGIPLEDSPHATYVRMHEMAHAVLSPRGGAPDAAANAAEDCRILGHLLGAKMPSAVREVFRGGYSRFLPPGHRPSLTAAIGMLGHQECLADQEWLRSEHPGVWDECFLVAACLPGAIWHPEKGWRRLKPRPSDAAALAAAIRLVQAPLPTLQRERRGSGYKWASLWIHDARRGRRSRGLQEEGLILKAPLNVLTQSPCFSGAAPVAAARPTTYLVDASSSMRWESLEEIRQRIPRGSVLALYGASSPVDGGALMIEPTQLHTWYDNLVDGPALEWLAKQPGRRYWITDGGVTGVTPKGESGTSPLLQLEVKALCQRHSITRITR